VQVLLIVEGMLSDAIFAVKLKSLQQLEELFDGQLCLAENIPQDGTRQIKSIMSRHGNSEVWFGRIP
jgi:hypothetical protein